MTKYKEHKLVKVYEADVEGGFYYRIYKPDGVFLTTAWTRSNAKEFIDSFDGEQYNWNILC